MKLLIKNMTGQPVSTPIGTLQPGSSLSHEVPEYKLEAVTTELVKLGSRISYSVGDLAAGRSITSPLTLYVETAGDDSNPGTQAKPYRTIQAALDSLRGVEIAAAVTIKVGAGEFDGFQYPQFIVPGVAVVTIEGTMVDATLSTGLASGIVSSGSSAVVNDTSQSWTVDDLKGKWVALSTAPTSYSVIVANSATSLTSIISTTPSTGVSYRIVQPGTIVKSNAVFSTTGSVKAGCVVMNVQSNYTGTHIIRNMKFTTSYGGQMSVGLAPSASMLFSTCEFHVATSGTAISAFSSLSAGSESTITLSRCYFNLEKTNSTGYSAVGSVTPQVCYFRGSNKTQTGIYSASLRVNTANANVFENLKYAFGYSSSYIAGSAMPSATSLLMGTFINCDVVCYTQGKVAITDSKTNYPSFPLTSAGNTTFILIDRSAQVQVHSNVPSGLATTDISVNGATSTLAAMRALSPKVFPATPNAYGSYVYE